MFTLQEAFDLVTKANDGFPYDRKNISDLGEKWAFHYDGSLGGMCGGPSPMLFDKETGVIEYLHIQTHLEMVDVLCNAPVVSLE